MVLSRSDLESIKAIFTENFIQDIAGKVSQNILTRLEERLKKQEETIRDLKVEIADLKSANHGFVQALDRQEQVSRSLNIRVFGVPKTENEDLRGKMLEIFKKMQVNNLREGQIVACHRIASKNPSDKPPAILIKFSNDAVRTAVLKNRKNLKSTNIQIKEDLTQYRVGLLTAAMKKFSSKMTWCFNGSVYVKINGVVRSIKSPEDINTLVA